MAAWRSLEADEGFCEQMVEHAEAASFRNRWDRDRLRFWQQRLRATRAATSAKVSPEVKNTVTEGRASRACAESRPEAVGRNPRTDSDCKSGRSPASPSVTVSSAPLAALPDPPAPTLFDKEEAAA